MEFQKICQKIVQFWVLPFLQRFIKKDRDYVLSSVILESEVPAIEVWFLLAKVIGILMWKTNAI